MAIRKPSDLNYDDNGFILPPLQVDPVIVPSDYVPDDELFFTGLKGLQQRASIRRHTSEPKIEQIKKLTDNGEQWLIWCG
jgi:hypothetical protein